MSTLRTQAIVLALALALFGDCLACDVDSDCGAGGTCIKREKRARGVCYGGNPDQEAPPAPAPDPTFFDPLSTPTERPDGACFVTEECPAGMECVKAGVWGRCMVL
jgi:hypothetical protein